MKRRLLAIVLGIALLVSAMPSFATEAETPVVPDMPMVIEEPVAPMVEEPVAPVVEEPAPVIEQPAPVVEEPAPVIEQPAPVVEEPTAPVQPEEPTQPEVPAEPETGDVPTTVLPSDPMNPDIPADDPSVPVAPKDEYPEDEQEKEEAVPVVPTGDPLSIVVERETSYVYINEADMTVSIGIIGGTAPYTVEVTYALGDEVKEVVTNLYTQPGMYAVSRMPRKAGDWRITVKVTDAAGETEDETVKILASERKLENDEDFERGLRRLNLTGDWRVDIITVAQYQLGYKESEVNAIIDSDGSRKGATRYGAWMGDPYSEWCASFIAYTMMHADISVADELSYASVSRWVSNTKNMGAFRGTDYFPQSGDIVFIIPEGESSIGHIGLVEFVTEGTIGTIEGNVSNSVARRSYHANSSRIGGYASMEALMEYAGVEFEPEAQFTYEVNEMEDRYAYVNKDKVNMRAEPNSEGERLFKHLSVNTQVLVTASIEVDEELWYQVQYKDRLGYIRGDLLNVDLVSGEEEISECGCYDLETGEQICTECACLCHGFELSVEEDTMLTVEGETPAEEVVEEELIEEPVEEPACTCTDETGAQICAEGCTCACHTAEEVVEEEPELPAEIVEWMATTDVTDDMLERALNASSLESLVIEGDALIYVRTGEQIATFDPENRTLTDVNTGLIVAKVDLETGAVTTISLNDDED